MPLGAADPTVPAHDARLSMPTAARRLGALAALLLALATVMGALESHLLRAHLSSERAAILQTAVQYQFLQSLGLLALSALLARLPSRLLRFAAGLLGVGIVLFSGSLYLLVAGAPRFVGVLTPLGGLGLIGGWLLAAIALLRGVVRPLP
jgi:uncharacterized membrane protein YgdD (TMEM256/DUF423 family)